MDHFKAMRTFVQVADVGSFVGASRAMDISPAVVTRVVAELEDDLGARLLTRTTRRVALTDIGRHFLERTRGILRDLDETLAVARRSHQVARGPVRLRASASFAAGPLAGRLPRFLAAHPQVRVELSASGEVDDIDETHDLTIALRREPLQGSFIARRLARTDVLLCAAPAYLDHAGRPDQPAALAPHPLLALPAETRRPLTLLGDPGGSPSAVTLPAPAPALSSENPQVHLAAALAGLGIAALPSYMVHDELASGRLERVLPAWHVQGLTVWACLLSRQHLPASTRGLLDFLLREFGGADADPWQA